jgi:hypothetical protein
MLELNKVHAASTVIDVQQSGQIVEKHFDFINVFGAFITGNSGRICL